MTPEAPEEVIRAAYRALAAKYHPDRNPGDRDAELKLKRLNAAFQVLGNPEKRKQYDELTQGPEATEATPETPQRQPPRWRVSEEPQRSQPRWKHAGEHENLRTSPSDGASRPSEATKWPRASVALFAVALSLYVNLTGPYAKDNPAAMVGLVFGCAVLGLFIYWLGGRIPPIACLGGVGLVAAVVMCSRTSSPDVQIARPKPVAAATTAVETVTATATHPPTVPEVPPLLPNETLPVAAPNYFQPREMSSGVIVVEYGKCTRRYEGIDPSMGAEQLSTLCTCVVDAVRHNFRASGDVLKDSPTMDQLQRCERATRSGAPLSSEFVSPRRTVDLWQAWTGCVRKTGVEARGDDYSSGSGYCDCFVDLTYATLKTGDHALSPADEKRCEVAGRYWASTKNYLTPRQFEALSAGMPTRGATR